MKKYYLVWSITIFVFSMLRGVAYSIDNPIFYLKFDQNCIAVVEGDKEIKPIETQGQLYYTKGVKGKALIVEPTIKVKIPVTNFPVEEGSFAVWLKPIDWAANDAKYHELIYWKFPDNTCVGLTKHARPGLGLAWHRDEIPGTWKQFVRLPGDRMGGWQPGAWHYVVGTWRLEKGHKGVKGEPVGVTRMTLWVDGEVVGSNPGVFQFPSSDMILEIGGVGNPGKTAVDEYQIFSKVLAREEIMERYVSIMQKLYE